MRITPLLLALCLLASPVSAQAVSDCEPTLAQARSIAEPWEANTATFADGDVRLAILDAIEPGAVPFHLMVLTPPYDELWARQCRVVSYSAGFGFSALTLEGLEQGTDEAGHLVLTLQAGLWNDTTGAPDPVALAVTIDTVTGTVTAKLR